MSPCGGFTLSQGFERKMAALLKELSEEPVPRTLVPRSPQGFEHSMAPLSHAAPLASGLLQHD